MIFDHDSFQQNLTNATLSEEQHHNVIKALTDIPEQFKYDYINTYDKRNRVVENTIDNHVHKTIDWLRRIGQVETAKKLEYIYQGQFNYVYQTKDDVWNPIRKRLQEKLAETGMRKSRFDKIAKALKDTFIQACHDYPCTEPPEHYDIDFDPTPYIC